MELALAKKLIVQTKAYYEDYGASFAISRQRDWALFLPLLQYIKKGDTALDLGCGAGRLYPLVVQREASYLGIDASRKILEVARKMYPQGNFKHGDILAISLPACFDAVFLIAVLHHLPSKELRQQAVQRVYRLLTPGGVVLISNWNLLQRRFWQARWQASWQKILGKSKLDWRDILFKQRRYYHGFGKREIAQLLARRGFKILENYYEKDGKRTGRFRGRNLVTIARKNLK